MRWETNKLGIFLSCIIVILCIAYAQGVKDKRSEDNFNLTDTGESDENWGNDGWKFKQQDHLNNMTEMDKERMRQCGKLFQSNQTMVYIKSCVDEFPAEGEAFDSDPDTQERRKRETFNNDFDTVDFSTLNIGDFFEKYNDKNNVAERTNIFNRHKRQPPVSLLDHSQHSGPWKIFENRHMKNPCVVTCLLQKIGMINSSGELDVNATRVKVESILTSANLTDVKIVATKIVSTCNTRYENIVARPNPPSSSSSDDAMKLKCRAVVHFGKCLARNVQMSCRHDQGILLNAKEISNKE